MQLMRSSIVSAVRDETEWGKWKRGRNERGRREERLVGKNIKRKEVERAGRDMREEKGQRTARR